MKKAWNKASRVISALLVLGMFASVVPAQALAVDEPDSQVTEQQDEEQTTEGLSAEEDATKEQSQDETTTEEQPQDETTTEEQPQDETTTEEQPQDETTTEEQPQDQEASSLLKSPQAKMGDAAPLTLGLVPYYVKNKTDANIGVEFSYAYQRRNLTWPMVGTWEAGETKTFWNVISDVTTLVVFVKVPEGYEPEFYFDDEPAEDWQYSSIDTLSPNPEWGWNVDLSTQIQAAKNAGYQWGFYYTYWWKEHCRDFEVKLNPVSYQINYNLNDGYWADGTEAKESYTVDDLGENGLKLVTPEREGYTFAGWTKDGVVSEPVAEMTIAPGTTGELSFTAHWNVSINLNFDEAKGETVTLNGYTGKPVDATEVPDTEREGYIFNGWYDEAGNKVEALPAVFSNKNVTYIASYDEDFNGNGTPDKEETYTITYTAGENGTVTVPAETACVQNVEGIQGSTAVANTGYLVDGWYKDGVKVTSEAVLTPDVIKANLDTENGLYQNTAFTALFVKQEAPAAALTSYTVRYLEDGTGYEVASSKTVSGVAVGTTVTETAPDVPGYTVTSDKNPQTFTLQPGDNTIYFYYKAVGPDQPAATTSTDNTATAAAAPVTPVTPRIAAPAAGGTTTAGTTRPTATAAPADGEDDNAVEEPAEEEVVPEEETPQAQEPAEDESIADEETPLAGSTASGWALLNLILAILTVIGAVVLVVGYFAGYQNIWRLLSLIPAIGGLIAFFLTEDMSQPMAFVDGWTVLMVIIAVVQIVVAVLALKGNGEDEEDDA